MKKNEHRRIGISASAAQAVKDHAFLWDDSWGMGPMDKEYKEQMDALMPEWQRKLIAKVKVQRSKTGQS